VSVQSVIKRHPAVGWVRGNQVASTEILTELNELRKANAHLQHRINELRKANAHLQHKISELEARPLVKDLAGLDDAFRVTVPVSEPHEYRVRTVEIRPTWRSLFSEIAPYLIASSPQNQAKSLLERALHSLCPRKTPVFTLEDQTFQTIKVHLMALGLVETSLLGDVEHWNLTPNGKKLLFQLRAVKKGDANLEP
jgi:hypothetical protein